jgi:hypothetical protein
MMGWVRDSQNLSGNRCGNGVDMLNASLALIIHRDLQGASPGHGEIDRDRLWPGVPDGSNHDQQDG